MFDQAKATETHLDPVQVMQLIRINDRFANANFRGAVVFVYCSDHRNIVFLDHGLNDSGQLDLRVVVIRLWPDETDLAHFLIPAHLSRYERLGKLTIPLR
jgi:hypothetical protein